MPVKVFHWFHKEIYWQLGDLQRQIVDLQRQGAKMATKAELQAKLDDIAGRQEAAVKNVIVAIDELKAQVNANADIVLDFSKLDAATADLENADGVAGPDGPVAPAV